MIEDERLSPSAAKVKYDRMVCLLKEKYKLRKNESQVTEGNLFLNGKFHYIVLTLSLGFSSML